MMHAKLRLIYKLPWTRTHTLLVLSTPLRCTVLFPSCLLPLVINCGQLQQATHYQVFDNLSSFILLHSTILSSQFDNFFYTFTD